MSHNKESNNKSEIEISNDRNMMLRSNNFKHLHKVQVTRYAVI